MALVALVETGEMKGGHLFKADKVEEVNTQAEALKLGRRRAVVARAHELATGKA